MLYMDYSVFLLETYTYYSTGKAGAKSEIDALPGGYWDPIGTQVNNNGVCFGGYFWSYCAASPAYRLQRKNGAAWLDWSASSTSTFTNPGSYQRAVVSTNYHFFVWSSY